MQRKKIFWALLVLSVFIGGFLRLQPACSRTLEYDEIYTLLNYTQGPQDALTLLRDIGTPNNHPLHTLLTRAVLDLLPDTPLAFRAVSLVAGLLTLVVGLLILRRLSSSVVVWCLGAVLLVNSSALIAYSSIARGYSLQGLWVLCFAYLLLLHAQGRRGVWQGPLQWLLVMLATWTLVTSIMFMGTLMLVHLLYLWRRGPSQGRSLKEAALWHGLSLLSCGAWLWSIRDQLQQARQFGSELHSLSDWFAFAAPVLQNTFSWPILVFLLIGLCFRRLRWLVSAALAVCLLPILAAVLSSGGPARAYLPALALVLLAVPPISHALLRRLAPSWQVISLPALLGAYLVQQNGLNAIWVSPDWAAIRTSVHQSAPMELTVFYPAAQSYPIRFYHGRAAVLENIRRLPAPRGGGLLQVGYTHGLSVCDLRAGDEVFWPFPPSVTPVLTSVDGVPSALVSMERLVHSPLPQTPELILAVIGIQSYPQVQELLGGLQQAWPGCWARHNPWLHAEKDNPDADEVSSVILAAQLPVAAWPRLLEVEKRLEGRIYFYRIVSPQVHHAP